MKGSYSRRDQDAENPTFIVESVTPFVELRLTGQVAVAIDVSSGGHLTPDVMRDVRAVVETHATRMRRRRRSRCSGMTETVCAPACGRVR